MNWGDLMAPPLTGLNTDLDLWTQDLGGMGSLSFPFAPQPLAPGFLDAQNSLQSQGMVASPLHFDEALITTVVNSAIMDPPVSDTIEQEQEMPTSVEGTLAPPAELPCSENDIDDHQGNVDLIEASMVSTEALEDQPLLATDGDHQESGMDVDSPIQDMTMTSPPPSPSRSKRRPSSGANKTTNGQRRTRKSSRASHSQRIAARLATSISDDNGDNGNDDDLERAANQIKRRRGSEDSSSDSCPDSAPSSPRTPPSTFEGPGAPSAEHTLTPGVLYHVDPIGDVNPSDASIDQGTRTLPSSIICQDSLLDSKRAHLVAVVTVEGLVNLKHMEDDGGDLSTLPHGRYPSRRPSTRPFGRF